MSKQPILKILFVLYFSISFAQPHRILCNLPNTNIKIESASDIPIVTDNGDGTITLTHTDQNITDIFSNYTVYDFFQSYPTANPEGELIKYYTIVFDNKNLLIELYNYTNPNIYIFDQPQSIATNTPLVNYLHNKSFTLIKDCYASTETGSECPEDEQLIPEDVNITLSFNYDSSNDILFISTNELTTCGNSFTAGFKGQADDGFGTSGDTTLQLWSSQLGISTLTDYDQPCHYIESVLYSVLDISCNTENYGNIRVYEDTSPGQFIITRPNLFFSYNYLTFREANLSVENNILEDIVPYKSLNNPYLQLINSNTIPVSIEIRAVSGHIVQKEISFKPNTILLSKFAKGLYFVKIKTLDNRQKVFKFLNN